MTSVYCVPLSLSEKAENDKQEPTGYFDFEL